MDQHTRVDCPVANRVDTTSGGKMELGGNATFTNSLSNHDTQTQLSDDDEECAVSTTDILTSAGNCTTLVDGAFISRSFVDKVTLYLYRLFSARPSTSDFQASIVTRMCRRKLQQRRRNGPTRPVEVGLRHKTKSQILSRYYTHIVLFLLWR